MAEAKLESVVRIPVGEVLLEGEFTLPSGASGIVVFAHGSGSGRFSPRNRAVAAVLVQAGLATLLMDLLTLEEESADRLTAHLRFDIELLTQRVVGAIDWLPTQPGAKALPIGCFGASTGAAAALIAASQRPDRVGAVVSRGGRPDLAGPALARVRAPTLLIVGGRDREVLELNQSALEDLGGPAWLEIVPGASHLFEEPGALERVAALARDFFLAHRWAGEA
jgi:putative phosphoribosyl transferase